MFNQWATAPGRSLNYPRPKSISHLCTFSDNGVYVALQLFLVILVSDQWRRVLIHYSYRQAPWGILHARGWPSRYTGDQQLYVVSEPREMHVHSPMLKARFLHLTILVAAEIKPQTFWLPGQRVTTRPQLSKVNYIIPSTETPPMISTILMLSVTTIRPTVERVNPPLMAIYSCTTQDTSDCMVRDTDVEVK